MIMKTMNNNPGPASQPVASLSMPINFYYDAPRAKLVCITGEFTHWQPEPMQRMEDGWWFVQAHLNRGFHQYRFLADGRPMLDPHAPGVDRDEQNEQVSVIVVI
jgi:1,4-alpha-glucan branching enzyme